MKKWTSAGKARVPLLILGLLDVLRAYPGQIPDLDAVLSVADFPCVPACVPPRPNSSQRTLSERFPTPKPSYTTRTPRHTEGSPQALLTLDSPLFPSFLGGRKFPAVLAASVHPACWAVPIPSAFYSPSPRARGGA